MELNSGADVSIIPEPIYRKYFNSFKLKPNKTILRTYNGGAIYPIGILRAIIEYNGKTVESDLGTYSY